jgi:hypothetical protein
MHTLKAYFHKYGFHCHVAGSRKNVSGILLKQMLASCSLRGVPMSRKDYHIMSQGLDEAGHDLGRKGVDFGLAFPAWSQQAMFGCCKEAH